MKNFIRVILACSILLASFSGIAVASEPEITEYQTEQSNELVVSVSGDGNGVVAYNVRFDISDDNERDAFRSLANDEESLQDQTNEFEISMESIASNMDSNTERDISVHNVDYYVTENEDDEIGTITFISSWNEFADLSDGIITIAEPFSSGYDIGDDSSLTIVGPSNSHVTSQIEPDTQDDNVLMWTTGSFDESFNVQYDMNKEPDSDSPEIMYLGLVVMIMSVLGGLIMFVTHKK